ncbi:DNA polymerase III subunit chi, partial [Erythrobacter sp. NAP1]|uniref:DNA polymerase III subunit chi n=1 Tax=Erythrobacter sp. NAP1 TaxID=237727 RepID=UPI0000685235
MKVDFWQLSRDPVDKVVALIAQRVLDSGERLLVVSKNSQQREAISRTLWKAEPESFLANGEASAAGADRQPILLSASCEAANAASHVIFADGEYREPTGFERAFLLFDDETVEAARGTWKSLESSDGLERAFFRQDGG